MDLYAILSDFFLTYLVYFENIIRAYLPNLLESIFIVLAGWLTAWLVSMIVARLIRGFDYLIHKQMQPLSETISDALFWLIMIFSLVLAAQNLGFKLLAPVLAYFPKIILAGIILFIGYILANISQNIILNSLYHLSKARVTAIAILARWLIIIFFVILAIDQLNIKITLLSNLIMIGFTVGLLCLGFCLALSLSDILKNMLAMQQLQKQYRQGECLSFDHTRGRIVDFTQTHLILENDEGQIHIPGQRLQRDVTSTHTEQD